MPLLFSYGWLQRDDVQVSTFGRSLPGKPDELHGFELSTLPIDDPGVVAETGESHYSNVRPTDAPGNRVIGTVFDITDAELAAADAFEEPADYKRQLVTLASGTAAWVYAHRGPTPAAKPQPAAMTVRRGTPEDADAIAAAHLDSIRSIGKLFY